jgi:type II secretory ATPase GspE/PulE/Tfp pilus assembly ATPase PilB-like protein
MDMTTPPAASDPDSAEATTRLDWPTPHHFRVTGEQPEGHEPGVVTMNDGRKLVGTVVQLDALALVLEFQPHDMEVPSSIRFSELKSVCLTRTIDLVRVPLGAPAETTGEQPASGPQKCTVEFRDGLDLVLDIVGIVVKEHGLFLFFGSSSSDVQRWFIPMDAISKYQIGDPLGKILVDRHLVDPELVDAGLEKQHQLRTIKLGDYLHLKKIVTNDQLEAALKKQRAMRHLRLGDALMQESLINDQHLNEALGVQAADRKKPLGEILVEMGVVSKDTIKRVLVEKLGIPLVDLRKFQYEPNAIRAVSAEMAHKYTALPLYRTLTRIAIAMEDPMNWEALQALEFFTSLKVDPVLATREDLVFMLEQFYGVKEARENISELVAELGGGEEEVEAFTGDIVTDSDNTLVRLVNKMIADAVQQEVSDIHIESMPGNRPSRVRFRKDGVLAPYTDIPANFRAAVISRIKVMSGLDISEKRRPQDGKINFQDFGSARVELRVVTMPTANGLEHVVMRVLTAPRSLSLDQIGVAPQLLAQLKEMAEKPYGLIFVCGPTGSGKTTTLHSLLGYINTADRKIWTVEDPIEITQDGLCQVQVNAKIGLTFPEILRSFLRADPDVIMVGETRDQDTARTVVAASLTGHLVLSTMHTNNAVESVVRLLDIGLDPFNFSDALIGIVGQRLVRRLCAVCRKPHAASQDELDALAAAYCFGSKLKAAEVLKQWRSEYAREHGSLILFSPEGCQVCDRTGYRGRIGLHELLVASPTVKAKIQSKADMHDITRVAVAEGMLTLKQDGIHKILQGHTDLKQVRSVCL